MGSGPGGLDKPQSGKKKNLRAQTRDTGSLILVSNSISRSGSELGIPL